MATVTNEVAVMNMPKAMRRMGVARFGINLRSAVEIVRSVAALPGGTVEVEG